MFLKRQRVDRVGDLINRKRRPISNTRLYIKRNKLRNSVTISKEVQFDAEPGPGQWDGRFISPINNTARFFRGYCTSCYRGSGCCCVSGGQACWPGTRYIRWRTIFPDGENGRNARKCIFPIASRRFCRGKRSASSNSALRLSVQIWNWEFSALIVRGF